MRTPKPSTAELSAEFAGTLLLMLFGLGVEAQVATAVPTGSMGGYETITWAWGFGVVVACYVAARLSGAHLNPAVTLALAICNGFPWRKVAGYMAAQMAGGVVAAFLVRALYNDLITKVDPGTTSKTQTVFSTLPGDGVTLQTALFDQVLGTAILVFAVCALTAAANNPPLANLEPVVVGLLVVGIGMAWGANAGYAINPARDLGPRFVSWITGYETAWVDQTGTPYWWVPVVGPLVGGIVGAGLFRLAIARFLPSENPGVDPFAVADPQVTARARLAEQLAVARDEATVAVQQARVAAERAHVLESGYTELVARAAAQGWAPDELRRGPQTGPTHTGPTHTGPTHTGPTHTGPTHTGPTPRPAASPVAPPVPQPVTAADTSNNWHSRPGPFRAPAPIRGL